MAYNTNGLSLKSSGLSGQGFNDWQLDTTDVLATVNTSGYITDAEERGMQAGDRVEVRRWTAVATNGTVTAPPLALSITMVQVINADGSADLLDGTDIASADAD